MTEFAALIGMAPSIEDATISVVGLGKIVEWLIAGFGTILTAFGGLVLLYWRDQKALRASICAGQQVAFDKIDQGNKAAFDKIDELGSELDALESKFDAKITSVRDEMDRRYQGHDQDTLAKLDRTCSALREAFAREFESVRADVKDSQTANAAGIAALSAALNAYVAQTNTTIGSHSAKIQDIDNWRRQASGRG